MYFVCLVYLVYFMYLVYHSIGYALIGAMIWNIGIFSVILWTREPTPVVVFTSTMIRYQFLTCPTRVRDHWRHARLHPEMSGRGASSGEVPPALEEGGSWNYGNFEHYCTGRWIVVLSIVRLRNNNVIRLCCFTLPSTYLHNYTCIKCNSKLPKSP